MELSLLLLRQIVVMALMVAVGVIGAKTGLVTQEGNRTISLLTLYIIVPCTLIDALQTELEPEKLEGMAACLLAALLIFAFMLIAGALLDRRRLLTKVEQTATIYSNSGNLIIPIILATLGSEFVIYSCVYMAVQNVLTWTHAYSLILGNGRLDLKKGILNPSVCGIAFGAVLFFTRLRLPPVLGDAVSSIGACLGPMSMISIGVMLAGADLKRALSSRRTCAVVLLRLLLFPLGITAILAAVAALWPGRDVSGPLTVMLLCSIGPTATTVTQLAQLADSPESGHMSSINAATTILCAVTMPAILFLYQMVV